MGDLRYYLYISDSKVDMLFPQVPDADQKQTAAKFGFDVKILSASFEVQQEKFKSGVARLQAVEEYIRTTQHVGTPRARSSWIAGAVDAKLVNTGDGAIFFVARSGEFFLALGGSEHHLTGAAQSQRVGIPFSLLPSLTGALLRIGDEQIKESSSIAEEKLKDLLAAGAGGGFSTWVTVIKGLWDGATVPSQRIDFLAKRLATEEIPHSDDGTTLATPLYVALVE